IFNPILQCFLFNINMSFVVPPKVPLECIEQIIKYVCYLKYSSKLLILNKDFFYLTVKCLYQDPLKYITKLIGHDDPWRTTLRESGYMYHSNYCTKDFRHLMTNLLISCGMWNEIDMNHIRDVIKNHCSIPSQPSKTYINYMEPVTNLDIDREEIYYY